MHGEYAAASQYANRNLPHWMSRRILKPFNLLHSPITQLFFFRQTANEPPKLHYPQECESIPVTRCRFAYHKDYIESSPKSKLGASACSRGGASSGYKVKMLYPRGLPSCAHRAPSYLLCGIVSVRRSVASKASFLQYTGWARSFESGWFFSMTYNAYNENLSDWETKDTVTRFTRVCCWGLLAYPPHFVA
jgi:hypothetical protein